MAPLNNEWWRPVIMAYVAELLVTKVQGVWEVETAIGNRYGATCWECMITDHVGARRVIASECLFIVPHSWDKNERGPGRLEQRRADDNDKTWDEIIIWCRGEGDDDPFCGRAEVEIRAAMEIFTNETWNQEAMGRSTAQR